MTMTTKLRLLILPLITATAVFTHAGEPLPSQQGTCSILAGRHADQFELKLNRGGDCTAENRNCQSSDMDEAAASFSGITTSDLTREGAHLDAVLSADPGTLHCIGVVHDLQLTGSYVFEPNSKFIEQMRDLGIAGLASDQLLPYTLFHVQRDWVESLKKAGVTGINGGNLLTLRIFKVDADYVRSLQSLGYPPPSAEKLIALRVQGVDPAEIKQVQAMGYHPTIDELIQMRIFKVTPDFIERMRAKGFENLTIAKLVQIRIFKLAE
jgi:hypothetical protein